MASELPLLIRARLEGTIGYEIALVKRELAFTTTAFSTPVAISAARPDVSRWLMASLEFSELAEVVLTTDIQRAHQLAPSQVKQAAQNAISFSVVLPGIEDCRRFDAAVDLAVNGVSLSAT